MSAENKYISNLPTLSSEIQTIKNIQIGVVESNEDEYGLGRIKVRIPGPSNLGGDDGTATSDLPWAYPMIPKYITTTPKVGEGVFIMVFSKNNLHVDRLYLGPLISTLTSLNNDPIATTGTSPFTFGHIPPPINPNRIPALKGVFPNNTDVTIQGRYNTDIVFKKNEILIRAGKFIESTPSKNNPYPFEFNKKTQGFIQIRNNVPIKKEVGSVTNIIGSKINLITHQGGSPRFNVTNQDDLISNEEINKILETAHPIPFGDVQLEYLKLLKNAFLNHVHNNNGIPATDLISSGSKRDVLEFKKQAEVLEAKMLSQNIKIN